MLTLAASIVTGKFRRAQDGNRHSHLAVNLLTGMYFSVLIIWGMIVSAMHYLRGEQIVTFYVVVIIAVLFVKLRPLLSATMILASFTVYYIWLELFLVPGRSICTIL